jgi:16S rRNA (adenine1518-N6/adenine1519-N6)-dimethyltransferase
MSRESKIQSRLARLEGIRLSERLGQHILVDEGVLNMVTNQVDTGSNVLEVGSGPGNLTERMASRANRVVGIEIDRRFQPFLDEVQSIHTNVEIIYKDALTVDLRKIIGGKLKRKAWQIISNLPFHISEPFLTKIIDLPIENAILIVGDQLARRMQIDRPEDLEFSRTSLVVQTFFKPVALAHISKGSFYPRPSTNASLLALYPRDKREFESNPRRRILRNLFLSERANPTVVKVIKESIGSGRSRSTLSKKERHRLERRQLRQELRQLANGGPFYSEKGCEKGVLCSTEVDRLGLPRDILSKPFSRLDNQDLRILVAALKKRYG